jgi:WD40 repeat protein
MSLWKSLRRSLTNRKNKKKNNKNNNVLKNVPTSKDGHDETLTIPSSIWISHIFPYLDRHAQNRLCVASKDVYEGMKTLAIKQPWPHGRFQIKKIVLAAVFSPSGDELAFVTANSKIITIWNRQSGFDQNLRGHKGACSDVAYAQSNEFLVSCSRTDGRVLLWGKQDDSSNLYSQLRSLNVQAFTTTFVRVSPDSKDIVSIADHDGRIYVSNAEDGTLIASTYWRSRLFLDCYGCYDCISFSTKRKNLLAHTFNTQTVRLWNYSQQHTMELEDNDQTRIVDYAAYVTAIQFVETEDPNAPEHEYLAVGCRVAIVKIWELSDYTCLYTLFLGNGWSAVQHLVFNKDGTKMGCTSGGKVEFVLNFGSGGKSVTHLFCLYTVFYLFSFDI